MHTSLMPANEAASGPITILLFINLVFFQLAIEVIATGSGL